MKRGLWLRFIGPLAQKDGVTVKNMPSSREFSPATSPLSQCSWLILTRSRLPEAAQVCYNEDAIDTGKTVPNDAALLSPATLLTQHV